MANEKGMDQSCFHLSIPAIDLALSRHWYEQVLGYRAGRCSDEALILDLGGHQLVLQRHHDELWPPQQGIYPRHFGLIFQEATPWHALRMQVEQAGQAFAVRPKVRFAGEVLEHQTFFRKTPATTGLSSSTTATARRSWGAKSYAWLAIATCGSS